MNRWKRILGVGVILGVGSILAIALKLVEKKPLLLPNKTEASPQSVTHLMQNPLRVTYPTDKKTGERVAPIVGWEDIPAHFSANQKALSLKSGRHEPEKGLSSSLAIRAKKALEKQTNSEEPYVMVLCKVPLQKPMEQALSALGAKVVELYPPNSYAVRIAEDRLISLASHPHVEAVFEISGEQKVDPAFKDEGLLRKAKEMIRFAKKGDGESQKGNKGMEQLPMVVSLYEADVSGAVREKLLALGAEVITYHEDVTAFVVHAPEALMPTISQLPEVSFLELKLPAQTCLETSVNYCGAAPIRRDATAKYGLDVTVGVIDSGFELNHEAFYGQSGYPTLQSQVANVAGEGSDYDDNLSGHGTHVLGIMMSRWANKGMDGVAPWIAGTTDHPVKLVRCGPDAGGLVNTDQAIDLLTSDNQSLVINNSWGSPENTGNTLESRKVDASTWNNNQFWVFAAGNAGPNNHTVGSPGAAKNVLTVGNVQQFRNEDRFNLARSSSRGPTSDGRYKPEIYAIGEYVNAPDSVDLAGYTSKTGTSMAAPHVSAIAATLMDHYPNLQRNPAAIKALLIATAQRFPGITSEGAGSSYPVGVRGGLVDSYRAHFNSEAQFKRGYNWGEINAPGGLAEWPITVPAGNYSKMNVVLCYIEPPAAAGASSTVINGIVLYVDKNGDQPGPNGEWEDFSEGDWTGFYDTYKFVQIDNPQPGNYTIKAYGTVVATPCRIGLAYFLTDEDDNYEENETASYNGLKDLPGQWLSSIWGMGIQRDIDYYTIELTHPYNSVGVKCSFKHEDGNIDLALLDSSLNEVARSTSSSSFQDLEWIERLLTNGTYYIKVYGADNGNPYDLKWTRSDPDEEEPVIEEGNSVEVTMDEEGSPTPFALTLHAYDVNNDLLEWSIGTQPSHGSAAISGSNLGKEVTISYSPYIHYNGTDSFYVRVTDNNFSSSDTIKVDVVVQPVNDPVIFENVNEELSTHTDEDEVTSVHLTASDRDGDPLTWNVIQSPYHGTIEIGYTGTSQTVFYTPDTNYNGPDSFGIRVIDSAWAYDDVTISLMVYPRNDAPVNVVAPTLNGTPKVGSTLTLDPGVWNDEVDVTPGTIQYRYLWRRADDATGAGVINIPGATNDFYTLQEADNHKYILGFVMAEDDGEGYPVSMWSTATSAWQVVADKLYVSLTGSHTFPYITPETGATNIQAAVEAAEEGQTVVVLPGVYNTGEIKVSAGDLANRVMVNKAIRVESLAGPESTIIQGEPDSATGTYGYNAVRCVFLANGAELVGFTLTNGYTRSSQTPSSTNSTLCGGGVYLSENTVVSNCFIQGNAAYFGGGGYIKGGVIADSIFSENVSNVDGGGIYATRMYPGSFIQGCLVVENLTESQGGGVYADENVMINNCTLSQNEAGTLGSISSGGGIYCYSDVTIHNTIIYLGVSPSLD